jgi:hypothetical protein
VHPARRDPRRRPPSRPPAHGPLAGTGPPQRQPAHGESLATPARSPQDRRTKPANSQADALSHAR